MNVYRLTKETEPCTITRLADGASIPPDPANSDYAEYLRWKEEGNTPLSADPVPPPDMSAIRAEQYRRRSDPIFFKWQRGTATKEEWLAEIEAIKAEYPDVV